MEYTKQTIDSYETNFDKYLAKKAGSESDSASLLEKFAQFLKGKDVLEIGFGLGNDARWLIEHGFNYTGIDPVPKFNQYLKEVFPNANLIQQDIRVVNLPENSFDGIWAMSSLLHFNNEDLHQILDHCHTWLKQDGVMYISLKEGEGEITRDDGRYFNLFTKERFLELVGDKFELLESSTDEARAYNTGQENWMNFYLKKK